MAGAGIDMKTFLDADDFDRSVMIAAIEHVEELQVKREERLARAIRNEVIAGLGGN